MKVTAVRPGDLGQTEAARRRELHKSTPAPDNPFLSIEFAQAMGELLAYVNVAVIEDGRKTAGFLPFERHGFGIGKPLGGFLTTCHGMISDPALPLSPLALMRACRVSVFDIDHLIAGRSMFAPYESSAHPAPIMDLAAGFKPYVEQVRAGSAKNHKTSHYKNGDLEVAVGRITRPSSAAAVHFPGRAPLARARNVVTGRPALCRAADRLFKGFGRLRTSGRLPSPTETPEKPSSRAEFPSSPSRTGGRSGPHLPDLAGATFTATAPARATAQEHRERGPL